MIAAQLLDLPAHGEHMTLEVDVLQGEAEQFTLPQPAGGSDHREQAEQRRMSVDYGADSLVRPGGDLLGSTLGHLDDR
ncbi:hypothetical protein E1286_02685 [Nonomuraea terrae]|uniref:Uncharacterized protein n=1 Tax=Nonomuraea terrae TaxID=2530383 RepID=A0A4R4ZCS3_9ACTN|nr:hypothetical protein [Nonomuraea terrae]TDD56241.1 hypothetical protein E1286_02685 [Nonomuraea terrae]